MRSSPSPWKLPALSGVLFCLAFYSGLLVPNLIAFVPLMLWLDLSPEASRLRRMWAGFAFGVGLHVPGLHFHYAMLEYSWLAALLYVGMILAFSIKNALCVGFLGWVRARTRGSFGWVLPVCWIPFEWLSTWGDLRMTADHVGHSMIGFPFLVQFADVLGPYGVGAVVLAINGLIYETLYGLYRRDRTVASVALAVTVAVVLAYDAWAWQRTLRAVEAGPTLRVALVQPNVPIVVKRDAGSYLEQWDTLDRLTREAAQHEPDLIVWPETARPWALYHLTDDERSFAMVEVQRLARRLGVALLVGADYARGPRDGPFEYYNAAFLVHPDGTLDEEWGAKVYLVPFTEGVPFASVLGPLVEGRGGEWQWVAGGFTPGPESALLPVRPPGREDADPVEIGVLVCYEEFYFDLGRTLRNRGAEVQAVITNDAWFGRSLFQTYQADIPRLRAIENRTSYVRVANTGISAFIDPLGRSHDRTPLFEEAVVVRDVPLAVGGPTVYDRSGDVVAWVAIVGAVAASGLAAARSRRARTRARWRAREAALQK